MFAIHIQLYAYWKNNEFSYSMHLNDICHWNCTLKIIFCCCIFNWLNFNQFWDYKDPCLFCFLRIKLISIKLFYSVCLLLILVMIKYWRNGNTSCTLYWHFLPINGTIRTRNTPEIWFLKKSRAEITKTSVVLQSIHT